MSPARAPVLLAGLVVFAVLLATSAGAGKWETIERLPGRTPVTVLVEGKARNYFRITPDKPLTVPLDGPVVLRVLSRFELPHGSRQAVSYSLRVTEGRRELDHQVTASSASSQVFDSDHRNQIGKSRRLGVEVPAGRHVLAISVAGTSAVLVRLQQAAPRHGEEATVGLAPIDAPRTVTVTEGEKTILYSSVMPGRPVKLRVVGPTSLDLISRLDYDATMRGPQTYRLGLSERGRRLREFAFKTTKSTTALYTDLKDRVPSKFDRVRVPITAGLHEITIELLAPARGSAEIHARIPQPTTGDEE